MAGCPRHRRWDRLLERLRLRDSKRRECGDWFGEEPPDSLVREPRRPLPFGPSATTTLDLAE